MNKQYVWVTFLMLSLLVTGPIAKASGVSYNGDLLPGDSTISSGGNATNLGVSAEVQMDFAMPEIVAIGVFNNGGDVASVDAGAPILAGKYDPSLETYLFLNHTETVLNDVIKDGNEVDANTNNGNVIKVGGVAYSSTGSAILTATPFIRGGSNNLPNNSISVMFVNTQGDGLIDVAFNGSFTGTGVFAFTGSAASISTGPAIMDNADNRGTFLLMGDVIESSVTSADDVGIYQGAITVSAIAN